MQIFAISLLLWTYSTAHLCLAVTYNDSDTLLKHLLSPNRYNRDIRPKWDQLEPTTIHLALGILSVIELNDVTQRFKVSAYASMWWADEFLLWDVSAYGGLQQIRLGPNAVWKPKFFLSNTADELEPFKDQEGEMLAYHFGYVVWQTGNVLETTCQLDVEKFPFDQQTCHVGLCTFGYTAKEIDISAHVDPIDTLAAEWDISSIDYENEMVPLFGSNDSMACVVFRYTLKRKAAVFVLDIILPVILMSLINNLVFLIPVESGEKISFGVTVLLALTVFLTLISSMLPRSSVPLVTIYLCILMVLSVMSVVMTVVIVAIYHRKEESPKEDNSYQTDWWHDKLTAQMRHVNCHTHRLPINAITLSAHNDISKKGRKSKQTKDFQKIARTTDIICFVLSNCVVVVATILYFIGAKN